MKGVTYTASTTAIVLASILAIAGYGLKPGLDFRGGTLVKAAIAGSHRIEDVGVVGVGLGERVGVAVGVGDGDLVGVGVGVEGFKVSASGVEVRVKTDVSIDTSWEDATSKVTMLVAFLVVVFAFKLNVAS